MGQFDDLAACERHAALHDVLQLPHIPGKIVVHQQADHVLRQLAHALLHQYGVFLQEVIG